MVAPYSDYTKQADFLLWKYHGTDVVDVNNYRENLDPNFIIYRVAEIILIKAEALVMKGESGSEEWKTAIALINQIRERAMLPAFDEESTLEVSKLELLDMVLHEREMEFLGEGKRWYDLVRQAEYANSTEDVLTTHMGVTANVRNRLKLLLSFYNPIYSEEMKIAGVENGGSLVQNPVWDRYTKK
jgi:hypothetical protein